MSFTRPTPLGAALASTWAARIDFAASPKAVWKPNDWSMNGMSLSIVLGTPTTAIFWPRAAITAAICIAPRSVPSPPITNRALTFIRSRQSTISPGSWPPREVPRIVPPSSSMSLTTAGERSSTSWPWREMNPW